jgi:hypothetical protein
MVGEMPVERSAQAVADLLGHSSIAITGDVSGHTSNDTARAAIDGLAGRLGLSIPNETSLLSVGPKVGLLVQLPAARTSPLIGR